MALLADLAKTVMVKLVLWLKSAQKTLKSLLDSIILAINAFISDLKARLIHAGDALATTIATAMLEPIVRIVKSIWIMLKQGWKSLKASIDYLRNPENKNKPFDRLILEVGKIIIAGLSVSGAIASGELIEIGLMTIPVLAIEIPLLGSLASILGLFLGGLIAGVVGAIALSLIDKVIAKQQLNQIIISEIGKGNAVLKTQNDLMSLKEARLGQAKRNIASDIAERHSTLAEIESEAWANISGESTGNENVITRNEDALAKLNKTFE